jgi:hypothetical protein
MKKHYPGCTESWCHYDIIAFCLISVILWVGFIILQFSYCLIIDSGGCKLNITRIEYIYPGYRLGCWAQERVPN